MQTPKRTDGRIISRMLTTFSRLAYWVGWPLWHVFMSGSERTRVVVMYDNEVLLVCGQISSGHWGLPGGGLHRGEEATHGAAREVAEEIGLTVSPAELIDLGRHAVRMHGHRYWVHMFAVELVGSRPAVRRQALEIAEVRWAPFDEALSVIRTPAIAEAVMAWAER